QPLARDEQQREQERRLAGRALSRRPLERPSARHLLRIADEDVSVVVGQQPVPGTDARVGGRGRSGAALRPSDGGRPGPEGQQEKQVLQGGAATAGGDQISASTGA